MPDYEQRIALLERQIAALRRRHTFYDHWHDTMHSPWYKKLWWWLLGYRILALGTWYKAPWNRSARKYYS